MELLFAPFVKLAPAPQLIDIAIHMQSRLWAAGKVRSAGAFDTEVAAYAVHYTNANQHVVLVHYDSDYEHIASVRSDLVTRWIVPQGSVP